MIKSCPPSLTKLVVLGVLMAVALVTGLAHAETINKTIHVGCKLVATPNHPWIATDNTVLMAGGEDCND